jgi:hypothetical protein
MVKSKFLSFPQIHPLDSLLRCPLQGTKPFLHKTNCMKRVFFCLGIAALMAGCNNSTDSTAAPTTDETTSAESIDYAYLPANHPPDNWDRGDMHNAALVLKSLKAWQNGSVDECLSYFADSVEWVADGMDEKLSKDQMRNMMNDQWGKIASVRIDMNDYESVISKDKKDQWVGLWYKQVTNFKDGTADSVYHMDDLKIDNGKIVILDEKTRKYPAPK